MVVTPLVKVHTPDGKTVCKERDRKAYGAIPIVIQQITVDLLNGNKK